MSVRRGWQGSPNCVWCRGCTRWMRPSNPKSCRLPSSACDQEELSVAPTNASDRGCSRERTSRARPLVCKFPVQQRALGRVEGQLEGSLQGGARLLLATEVPQQLTSRRVVEVVAAEICRQRLDRRQRGGRPGQLAQGDGSVQA